MDTARNLSEVWLVYNVSEDHQSLGRRVAWGSANREMGWVSFPKNRTMIPVKERNTDCFSASGEASTYASTFTNVSPMPCSRLPFLSVADKCKILGAREVAHTLKGFDSGNGLPLCWQEKKPVDFWVQFLKQIDAEAVVDVTPGSGTVGRACMKLGLQYLAVCRSEYHTSWLQNVLDRQAVELIVTSQSPLYEQDLATLIETHFSDVLDQLNEKDTATDDFESDEAAN